MHTLFQFLADQPLLTLALIVGVGSAVGRVNVRGVQLGPAAVLFTAIALTAGADAAGVATELPENVGNLGLVVFALCVGLMSGADFFRSIRRTWPRMVAITVIIGVAGLASALLGAALGVSRATAAGVFAGALTNTPALSATGGSPEATVGYASAYVFGVAGALVVTALALRRRDADGGTDPVENATVRVEQIAPITIDELISRHGNRLLVTRMRTAEDGPARVPTTDTVLQPGHVVTVVGPRSELAGVIAELGHASSHDLRRDRAHVDFRRIILSRPQFAGRRVADLHIERDFGARVVRIRRGDVDLLATGDTALQLGDRLRVVGPPATMGEVTRRLGDSTRGLTALMPAALGLGLAAGIAIGAIAVPLPGGARFSLGAAGGVLLVGLLLGRLGRIGPVATTLPWTSATVLAEFGLTVFLAYAGTKAGALIGDAISSGDVFTFAAIGAVVTLIGTLGTLAVMTRLFHVGGITLSGMIGGAQTNPAVLAFASGRSAYDPRVPFGYAVVYPAAMIAKILIAQLIAG